MRQEVLTAPFSVLCWAEDLSHLYPVLSAFIPLLPSPDCETLVGGMALPCSFYAPGTWQRIYNSERIQYAWDG